ncbi:acyl carrier protein, partial [Paenibacillus sp. GbtcB18]|uniref:acyl carrier protein n=1 Tax=Paenibacillus sp. GbtcB18 TaxID=2824763 RepID=UPI001C2F231D
RINGINLPTYPFSKEKYWVERKEKGGKDTPVYQGQSTVIHPLLQPNSEVEFVYSNKINKPSGIKLNQLVSTDAQAVTSKSAVSNSSPVESCTLVNNDTLIPTPLDQKDDATDLIAEKIMTEEVIATLAEVLQLNLSDMDRNKKFIEMGLDSILGVEWVRSINKKYGISIPVTKVYDYPTITEFSGYLMREVLKSKKDNSSSPFIDDTELTSSSIVLNDVKSKKTSASLSELQEDLLQSLAESLYLSQQEIDPDKRFIDMGLDSIIGVEWVRTMNKKYGVSIPVTKVYDYPTIREFSMFLEKELSNSNEKECVDNSSLSIRETLEQVLHKKMSIEEANQIIFRELKEE